MLHAITHTINKQTKNPMLRNNPTYSSVSELPRKTIPSLFLRCPSSVCYLLKTDGKEHYFLFCAKLTLGLNIILYQTNSREYVSDSSFSESARVEASALQALKLPLNADKISMKTENVNGFYCIVHLSLLELKETCNCDCHYCFCEPLLVLVC